MSGPPAEIGRVRSVNPARREVRVAARPGYAGAFAGRSEMEFALSGGGRAAFAVETVEEQNRYVKLTLAAGTSADDVASLKGAKVFAGASRALPDSPFEAAAAEYAGFRVTDLVGDEVGVVAGGFNTRAHGVLEIAQAGGASVLAPFVPEVVAEIRLAERVIVLRDAEAHLVALDGDGTMA